jgi:flagellar basal-body rod modification protein FlgD
MSIATTVAQQNAGLQTADLIKAAKTAAGAASTATSAPTAAATAATGLAGNFSTFLKMLMTQLQNQDPTSPLDTNQFTSQLVQFSSVEQQINTNSSLTSLIQLTQSTGVLQSSAMVGHQVAVDTDHLTLQKGAAEVNFTTAAAGQVAVAVLRDDGTQVATALVDATAGSNVWKWDGASPTLGKMPDGSYRIAVVGIAKDGTTQVLPTTTIGTATGVEQSGTSLQLQLGSLTVPFAKVKQVLN